MHEADLPNRVRRSPSIEYAACFQSWIRTRSRTLPPPQDAPQSVRQMPAWLPSFASPELRRAASSVPCNPAAADGRLNVHHVAGLTPPQTAKAPPATSSDAAVCCETHLTAVAAARLDQEWAMCFCYSISADLDG